MPRYVLVPEREVAPGVVAMARDIVAPRPSRAGPGRHSARSSWFADARELPARQVAAASEVYIPGDGIPKAGSVPPFVRYSAETGWEPAAPVILLNRSQCLPDTPLHELRHLWQIKAGLYRADQSSTQELEDDADAWAAGALTRLGTLTARADGASALAPRAAACAGRDAASASRRRVAVGRDPPGRLLAGLLAGPRTGHTHDAASRLGRAICRWFRSNGTIAGEARIGRRVSSARRGTSLESTVRWPDRRRASAVAGRDSRGWPITAADPSGGCPARGDRAEHERADRWRVARAAAAISASIAIVPLHWNHLENRRRARRCPDGLHSSGAQRVVPRRDGPARATAPPAATIRR